MSNVAQPPAGSRIADMTDSDFASYVDNRIRDEQDAIDAQVAAGATLIRSGQGKIHTLACAYSGHFPTRRDAYNAFAPSLERLRTHLAGGKSPVMPVLLKPHDAGSQIDRYQRCGTCTPPIPDYTNPARQPRNASELITALKTQLDSRPSASHAALLAVLRLHYAPIGHACPADGRLSPCSTTTTILRAYGIKP